MSRVIDFFLTDWIQEDSLHGQRIGYVRVSSFDQNPERQLEHVQVDRLFTDKASGKDTQRPELERLLAFAREGDTVVVHSMDRLARNLDDLRLIVQKLTKRGVRIEFVTSGKSDLHRRGLAAGEPDAVGHGGLRRIRAGLDPRTSARGDRPCQAAWGLSGPQEIAIAGADGPATPAGAGWRAEGPPGPRVWHQSGNPLSIPAHGRLTMPRRSLLTPAERASLLAFPTTDDELIRHYTFSEFDLASIRQRRGNHNRLGFAVQLCYLRYPGLALPTQGEPPAPLLAFIGRQLHIEPDSWPQYAKRPGTRREHLAELQAWLNLRTFSAADHRRFVEELAGPAQQTDRGIVLAEALVERLRQQRIILPTLDVIERVSSEALTRGTRLVYEALTGPLSDPHRRALDALLSVPEGGMGSGLVWLRSRPVRQDRSTSWST